MPSCVSGWWVSAHSDSTAPPAAPSPSTATARRRIGVTANHSPQATIAAITRAARVRHHEHRQQDRQRRDAERPEDPAAAVWRAPAQMHAGMPERGGETGRVPVVERCLQAADRVVGVKRAGEHLDQQGIRADRRRRGRDGAEHRRPALGRDPRDRDRRAERRQVGERAVGLDPRVVGLDRPRDRRERQRRQRREQQQRDAAPRAPRAAVQNDGRPRRRRRRARSRSRPRCSGRDRCRPRSGNATAQSPRRGPFRVPRRG